MLTLDALHRTEIAAAATSAKRARRPTARRCATTRTSRTPRRGNSRASASRRAAQGAARLRIREAESEELQVASSCQLPAPQRTETRRAGNCELETGSWKLNLMRIHLKVWRQAGPNAAGRLVDYTVEDVSPDMSFLEMLDVLNEGLIARGEDPIAFDSDCREGICGTCGFLIDGIPHGPDRGHDRVPAAHAAVQEQRPVDARAVAGARRFRSSRISSSTAAPSIGSSRPAAIPRSTSAARRTPTPS